ncbi:MAG: heavy metal-binding domain-containing protein, partial [Pirellulales bacterium]
MKRCMPPGEADTPLGPPGGRPWIAAGWRRVLMGLRIAQVRLRFLLVLAVAFAVVGQWHVIRNHWDQWTGSGRGPAAAPISSDTEYFCPMDPGVLSDWPTRCSICNMALVRRHKGEAATLPDGVVARMQLSPYRLQLAGIETSRIDFLPLAREVEARGTVLDGGGTVSPRVEVQARIRHRDVPYVFVGQAVEVAGDPDGGKPPLAGRIISLAPRLSAARTRTARLEVDNPDQELLPGMNVRVTARVPLDEIEPMRSQPTNPPPPGPHDVQVYVCPDHADVLEIRAGNCPLDDNELVERPLTAHQRLSWWCPMHPQVTAGEAGKSCPQCQGMELLPRVVSYRLPGQVLAVPETAVVDTGARQVVYVETAPGMFDGVEVALAERCGGYYPVISGLEAGQRVAIAGAFLIDAETRLNPGLATAYF